MFAIGLGASPAFAKQRGLASYYGPGFAGRRMADGHVFHPRWPIVAHRTLPLGTRVRVRNLRNGRTVLATVRDRGPYVRGRILDLSEGCALVLGAKRTGLVPVEITVLALGGGR